MKSILRLVVETLLEHYKSLCHVGVVASTDCLLIPSLGLMIIINCRIFSLMKKVKEMVIDCNMIYNDSAILGVWHFDA